MPRLSRRTKYILAGVAGFLVLLMIVASFSAANMKEARIETVEPRNLAASVTASGQIQPQIKVDISSDITGRITKLAVKEGDIVTKGQFLLEIDPEQYQAPVSQSKASVASARAQQTQAQATYDQAKRQYERVAQLKERNPRLVSADQVEKAKTDQDVAYAQLMSARHGVAQAQAALRDAQSSLNKTVLRSPIDGQVTRVNVELGETAIMGTLNKDAATLLTISDMSILETQVKVDETDVAHITVGDSAEVDIDAFPDSTFRGVVTRISSSSVRDMLGATTTDRAVDYEVTIRLLDAPEETRPDFSTQARIITARRSQVLTIPIIALTIRENTPIPNTDEAPAIGGTDQRTRQPAQRDTEGVFVVGENNQVTFRPVQVGIAGENYFEVLEGLQRGERVVAGTYQVIRELKDGDFVREASDNTERNR